MAVHITVYVHCKRVWQLVLCDVKFAKADLMPGHSFIQPVHWYWLPGQLRIAVSLRPQLVQVLVQWGPMAWSRMLVRSDLAPKGSLLTAGVGVLPCMSYVP